MSQQSLCKKCGECCGEYHVPLHPNEATKFKHKRLEQLKEKGIPIGVSWVLNRDKEGFCLYFDKETRLCTVHDIKPKLCKDFICKKGN